MKQLTCEMCGSTDLMKQDGVFVCQSCGTKYSVEEARKMMVEGTVDVTGSTVKVDTSAELANLYQIARRAKDDNNGANAAKYYDMILVKDPTSWEAQFYVVYFKAMECKIAQIRSAAISVSNCEDSVLALIRDHVAEENQEAAVAEVVMRSIRIANMLEGAADDSSHEYLDNACAARDILYTCGSQVERIFGNQTEIARYAADAWKAGIDIHSKLLSYYLFDEAEKNKRVMASYAKKIGKYDPAYEKRYTYADKKPQLELDISVLKSSIANIRTEDPKWNWNGWGIFFIVCGVFMIVCGVFTIVDGILADIGVWPFLVGVPELALGIAIVKPDDMKTVENNRKIVSEAKAKLAKKEAELKELEAELKELTKKEKEEAKKRFDEYWAEHADEKASLETERATLEEQIATLRVEISHIPGNTEKENIQERINALNAEKRSLGLFKGKEKKAVQEKIDAANLELKKIVDKMENAKKEIEKKIEPLQKRVNEINAEFSKAR